MVERCTDVRARLSPFLDGVLDPAEMQDVMRHVAACPACTRVLDEMRAADALLREPSIEPEAEAGARERTLARLHAEPEPAWARIPVPARPRVTPLQWGIPLAAAAAVLVTLRLVLIHPEERPRLESAPRAGAPQSTAAPATPGLATDAPQSAAPSPSTATGMTAQERSVSPRASVGGSRRASPPPRARAQQDQVVASSPVTEEKSLAVSKAASEPANADQAAGAPAPSRKLMNLPVDARASHDSVPSTFRDSFDEARVVPLGKTYADTTGPVAAVVQVITQRSAELKRLAAPETPEERIGIAREWTTIAALWEWVARKSTSADERTAATDKAADAQALAQSLK